MMRNLSAIIAVAAILPIMAKSQPPSTVSVQEQLDSLKMAVANNPDEETAVENLREITQLYFTGFYQMDSAKKYASLLGETGSRLGSDRGIALSNYYLGRVADGKGDYANAIAYSKRFLESDIVKADTPLLANGLYSLANIHIHQGNLEEAMNYQLQVLRLDEASGNQRNIGLSLNNMGIIMKELNRDKEAIGYLERTLSIFEKLGDKGNTAMALSNLGGLYARQNNQAKALRTFERSLALYKDLKHERGIALAYQHIATIERNLGQYPMALNHIRRAIEMLRQIDLKKETAESYHEMALIQRGLNNNDSARFYLLNSLELAREVGDKKAIRRSYKELADMEAHNRNFEKAYAYFQSYHAISDSILNESIANQISLLETKYEVQKRETEISNLKEQQQLNDRNRQNLLWALIASSFLTLSIIGFLIYRVQTNRKLLEIEQVQNRKVEKAYSELKNTQTQLIHAEKMASLGELTAGIAHEIQNPLKFVNNFSEVSSELVNELKNERSKESNQQDQEAEDEILDDISRNLERINFHGKRADSIVKSMLQHTHGSSGEKEPTDINALADECLRLSFHGMQAKDKSLSAGQAGFNPNTITHYDPSVGMIRAVPQDISKVLINLLNNAFYAVAEKQKEIGDTNYEPTVTLSTKKVNGNIIIRVRDNGTGIPDNIREKIFQPFFTTKPAGQGTGLGLSLSYDIVKAHGGELKLKSPEGEGLTDRQAGSKAGTEFIIELPIA